MSLAVPKAPPSKALQEALTKFRAHLSGKDLTDFENTTYETLCQDVSRIQKEQAEFKRMKNLSRIQAFLEAMTQFGKVIEVFLNVSNVIAFVWGPVKLLLLTANTFVESFEVLLDAYEQIGDQLPLLLEFEQLFHQSPHMLKALELIYMDILDFHQHAMRCFSGKRWTKFFNSLWKDFRTRFDGILKSLRRHKELIECRANLYQYHMYQEDMKELKAQLKQMVSEERNRKKKAVKEWLAAGSQAECDHDEFIAVKAEYPNTGRWIIKHEAMLNWMDADIPTTPMVWMNGIPGAGKTILASVVIDECKQRKQYLTSYFYCHYNGPDSNTAIGVFRGLLDQLQDQYPDLLPYCHSKYSHSGEPCLRSSKLARTLLEDFCSRIPKQYIIIDGLDECEARERKEILEVFVQLVGQCDDDEPGKLRVLFVSQNYADIRKSLFSSANSRIVPKVVPLSSADNENDIRIYVNAWVDLITDKHSPLSDDQQEHLRSLTVVRAQGMFLYAKLVMQNFRDQPTRGDLLEAITVENFPEGLEQAYERIVKRIKQTSNFQEWEITKKLLGWMVCAKRQLTWKEMQVALSIDFEAQSIDYDDRRLRGHIHDICGSLVLLSGDRVQLVHSTAKHYITRCTKDIHEASVECELAALCLQYLTFPCFQIDKDIDDQSLKQLTMQGHLAFQDYAVAKWFHHVNAFVNTGRDLLSEGVGILPLLQEMTIALDDFMTRYQDEDWDDNIVQDCEENCELFKDEAFYEHLVAVKSHIYTFQIKGFDARHIISIKSLATALERNRKLLEELPKKLTESELRTFRQFYDDERRYKCPRITCMYFSEGFKDAKDKKKHVNIHDRPFQCEASDCLLTECGFANSKDLEKHKRAFHPEMSDLAESFNPAAAKRSKATWACSICGKTFTRNFHRQNHEKSHRGERPHECPECGKAFTRLNDCKRHQKLHDRR